MTNAKQAQATERLLFLSERYGEAAAIMSYKTYGEAIRTGKIDSSDLYEELFKIGLNVTAKLGKPLHAAVSFAIGKNSFDFAPANLDVLGKGTNFIISRAFRDPAALLSLGTPVKDVTVDQLRTTVVSAYDGDADFVRVANSGACDWCQALEGTDVYSSDIEGHNGCGCYIGVK